MTPSLRSHPNHPQQPISLPYTRFVRGNGYDSGHRLRHSLAGSPLLQTESGSLSFGTASPPRAAPHPVSRRRSCLRLLSRCSSRDDSDFHWLISYMCVRTSQMRPAHCEKNRLQTQKRFCIRMKGNVAHPLVSLIRSKLSFQLES